MSVTNIRVRTTSARRTRPRPGPLDDLEDGPRLRRDVARVARPAVGSGVGRAGDPARVADDDRPAVAGGGLPRPARRDPPALASSARLGRLVAPGEDLGIRGDRQQQAGEQRRPRHDRIDLEVLRRRVVVAADRPEAVEARDAHAGRSCSRPTRRRSPRRRPRSPSAPATACACSTRRPLRSSFSIGHQRAIGSKSTVVSGTSVAAAISRIAASAVSSASRGRRPDVDLERAALGDDVRPRPAGDRRRR